MEAPAAAAELTREVPAVEHPVAAQTWRQALDSDRVRRAFVTISYVFCLLGALAAFDAFRGGSLPAVLSPSLSLLSPSALADRMWWLVILGLGSYVGWLWLPDKASQTRSRAMAYPSAISMALLGVWLFLGRSDGSIGAAVISVAVVGSLVVTLRAAGTVASRGFLARQVSQFGLAVTLGWMSIVAAGTVASALAAHRVPAFLVSADTWGVLGATALMAFAMVLLRYLPGRLYIAAAMSWGFVWLAHARLVGEPRSYVVAVVALVCALLVPIAAVTVVGWARSRQREGAD